MVADSTAVPAAGGCMAFAASMAPTASAPDRGPTKGSSSGTQFTTAWLTESPERPESKCPTRTFLGWEKGAAGAPYTSAALEAKEAKAMLPERSGISTRGQDVAVRATAQPRAAGIGGFKGGVGGGGLPGSAKVPVDTTLLGVCCSKALLETRQRTLCIDNNRGWG